MNRRSPEGESRPSYFRQRRRYNPSLLNPAILDQSLVPVKLISQSEEDPKENSGDGFGVNLPYGCWVRLKVAKIG